jgi:nucleoside-diphosphate-sugar epimerase
MATKRTANNKKGSPKILITGVNGFVGRNLREYLSKRYNVIGLGHKELDISNKKEVSRNLKSHKPDIVINCAVYGGYHYQKDKKTIYAVNWYGPKNLVDGCKSAQIPLFIQTGSSSEYGFKNKPMREDMHPNPNSSYADAKVMATKYCTKIKGVKTVVLRVFSVYGYYEPDHRLIPQLIIHSLNKTPVKMSSPNNVRDFIFIEDVCKAYDSVIRNSSKIRTSAIFNVGSGKEYKLKDVIKTYKRINPKLMVSWNNDLGREERDRAVCWQADITKIRKTLGWKPMHTLEEGLRLTTKWFKSKKRD